MSPTATLRLAAIVTLSAIVGALGATLAARPAGSAQPPVAAPATAAPAPAAPAAPAAGTAPQEAAGGQPGAAPDFAESFDGAPAAPQPWSSPAWDIAVHSRDVDTWRALEPMEAMHGPDCGAPPATHTVASYEGAVFQCRDHLMTAISAAGYGVIYLTPSQILDFSQGEAVIRWDMSTLRTSGRDWVDVWITPFAENLQLPLELEVDLSGPPRNAVHIRMDFGQNSFRATTYREFVGTELEQASLQGYEAFLTPDARRRDTFEVRISRGHLAVGMPGYQYWWVDTPMPELGWDSGVVQLGHHSYNPTKDCGGPCAPNTWHWDNVQLSPARPFTLIKAAQRYADAEQPGPIALGAPAPASAHLRFSGVGPELAVSFDEGASWQPAVLQAQDTAFFKDEHFRSYWMPIPPGTRSVQFRGSSWWGGGWHIRDISVWAQ